MRYTFLNIPSSFTLFLLQVLPQMAKYKQYERTYYTTYTSVLSFPRPVFYTAIKEWVTKSSTDNIGCLSYTLHLIFQQDTTISLPHLPAHLSKTKLFYLLLSPSKQITQQHQKFTFLAVGNTFSTRMKNFQLVPVMNQKQL